MQKWLLFFKPTRFANLISANQAFAPPFAVYMLMTIATGLGSLLSENDALIREMGTRFYNLNLLVVVFIGPFFPILGAAIFHGLAEKTMGLEGSLRRLILLFYYAGAGRAVCVLVIFLLEIAARGAGFENSPAAEGRLDPSSLISIATGLLLGLYSVSVDIRLLMFNYSIQARSAIKLVLYFALLVVAVIVILSFGLAIGMIGQDIPGRPSSPA